MVTVLRDRPTPLGHPRKQQDMERHWKQEIGAKSFVDGRTLKIKLRERIGTMDFEGSVFRRGSFCKVSNQFMPKVMKGTLLNPHILHCILVNC